MQPNNFPNMQPSGPGLQPPNMQQPGGMPMQPNGMPLNGPSLMHPQPMQTQPGMPVTSQPQTAAHVNPAFFPGGQPPQQVCI